ncbi:hypothetical protein BC830DRAFT_207950 [Chytriomyces sp. MP71]|nr:hypothetical protein BC830DRAFT_207950 [Chytriomyces sp. MP71]
MPASCMHLPNKISPQSFHFSSKSVLTSLNDPIMTFYKDGTKLKIVVDAKLLLDSRIPEQIKLEHLKKVMWSAFEFEDDEPGMALASAAAAQTRGNEWLQFHLRMIRRNESILYDLDMIGKHIGQFPVKSRSDLVLQLTLSRRTDEEICLRLSHICFKLWKLGGPRNVDEKKLVLDIQAYARMLGLSHLKHAVSLLS